MANFEIRSLSAGAAGNGNLLLQSDSAGNLTKITEEALKTFITEQLHASLLTGVELTITTNANFVITDNHSHQYGNVDYISILAHTTDAIANNTVLMTLPSNPRGNGSAILVDSNSGDMYPAVYGTDGIKTKKAIPNNKYLMLSVAIPIY